MSLPPVPFPRNRSDEPFPRNRHGDEPFPQSRYGDQPSPQNRYEGSPFPQDGHGEEPAPQQWYGEEPSPQNWYGDEPPSPSRQGAPFPPDRSVEPAQPSRPGEPFPPDRGLPQNRPAERPAGPRHRSVPTPRGAEAVLPVEEDVELDSYLAALAPDSNPVETTLTGRFGHAQVFQLRLPELRIQQLRRLAAERGVSPGALAVDWVVERLDREDTPTGPLPVVAAEAEKRRLGPLRKLGRRARPL